MNRSFKDVACTVVLGSVLLGGCSTLIDAPKNVLGLSVEDLQQARASSVYRTYGRSFHECFDKVLDVLKAKGYYVSRADRERGILVVMQVPGYVDTTEVGIFVVSQEDGEVKVEISSRSEPAKRAVARVLFFELEQWV